MLLRLGLAEVSLALHADGYNAEADGNFTVQEMLVSSLEDLWVEMRVSSPEDVPAGWLWGRCGSSWLGWRT